jgi:hypothetical protein
VWHINVIYVPEKQQYMMLLNAYKDGTGCGDTVLFFANSRDGVAWSTYDQILLSPRSGDWDSGEIYRSSLLYDPNTSLLRVWYSASNGPEWHTGYAEEYYLP